MVLNVFSTVHLWDPRYSQNFERKIAEFYGTEDTILYAAAFDANGGVLSHY
jgi:7-keto-8-aminopelargonate synthetase-like enzyme